MLNIYNIHSYYHFLEAKHLQQPAAALYQINVHYLMMQIFKIISEVYSSYRWKIVILIMFSFTLIDSIIKYKYYYLKINCFIYNYHCDNLTYRVHKKYFDHLK